MTFTFFLSLQMSVLDSSIFLTNDEELFEISFHVEKSTLAAAVGKSLAAAPKKQDFKWSKGKVCMTIILFF